AQVTSRAPHPRRSQDRQNVQQARPDAPPPDRQQAVRARHQCADARSHESLPLRRTRHLPADPHSRGARRAPARHDRGSAHGAPDAEAANVRGAPETELRYTGTTGRSADFWERHGKAMESWQQGRHTFDRITGPIVPSLLVNEFTYQKLPGQTPFFATVREIT